MGLLTRAAVAASVSLAGPLCAYAQQYPLTSEDITPKRDYSFGLTAEDLLPSEDANARFRAMAEEIGRKSTEDAMTAIREKGLELGITPDDMTPAEALAAAPGIAYLPEGFRATILISRAMGEGAILDLLARYRLRKDVRFVFRGVPEGMSVPEFAFWLKQLVAPGEERIEDLNITLDPELFERAGATLAPTLLLEDLNKPSDLGEPSDLDAGLIVARAEGLTDPDWLYDQMKKGQPDQRSPNVVEIEEEDLRARADREAEQVAQRLTRDADTLKDRFWKRTGDDLEGMAITPASADRTRQLHFMFKTSQPITDQDGRVLAHAGEVFQPSDVLPFDRRIFVFNPNDPDELQFVEEAFKAPRPNVSRTLLILTELPTVGPNQQPWDGLQAIVDRFGIQAFLLNDQFRNAFKIEVTPTEIYPQAANGTVSVISAEYSLN